MKVNWDDYSQYMGKIKKWQPTHQPEVLANNHQPTHGESFSEHRRILFAGENHPSTVDPWLMVNSPKKWEVFHINWGGYFKMVGLFPWENAHRSKWMMVPGVARHDETESSMVNRKSANPSFDSMR